MRARRLIKNKTAEGAKNAEGVKIAKKPFCVIYTA